MEKEKLINIINTVLQIDGVNIRPMDALMTVPKENLIALVAYILGGLEINNKDKDI